MATVRGFLKSRFRHLVSAVLVVLGVVTIVPAFSGTAAAHHAEANASVNCEGVISWGASAWAGYPDNPDTPENEYDLSRTNSNVRVWIEVLGSGTPLAEQFGSLDSLNGFAFSGTFQWPVGETGTIRLQAQALATWGNGGTAGPYAWPVDLTLPTDCEESTTTTTEESTTTTTEESTTTTTEESTTTTEESTTTTEESTTTTTEESTTTTEESTTTTEPATTTTTEPATTTTTEPATTTTVGCGGGGATTTTSPSCGGTTTTVRRPTTTVSGTLPSSGGGASSKSMLSMTVGFGCIGSALILSRPRVPRRWRAAFD